MYIEFILTYWTLFELFNIEELSSDLCTGKISKFHTACKGFKNYVSIVACAVGKNRINASA